MYKNSKYNKPRIPIYKIDCFNAVFPSKINTLALSILNKNDKTIKKATRAFEKAKGLPNVTMLIQLLPGMFIAIININE